MRLTSSAHYSRPWRIHELTRDFRLEDVWVLPTPGGPEDFPRLVALMAARNPERDSTGVTGLLMAVRLRLGRLLGWDGPDTGVGARVPSLRDRLPADLRDVPVPDAGDLPFKPVYVLGDECAAEIANSTMHGVLHLGWVSDGAGGHRGQMAILVKRNGLLGAGYLAAIKPFRHLLVYPAMLRRIERSWREGASQ